MTKKQAPKTAPPKLHRFDAADFLNSPEVIVEYLNQAFATGDSAFISAALGDIARTRGMGEISKEAKLGRQSLYKALSAGGNPSLDTAMRVLGAMGLKLQAAEA